MDKGTTLLVCDVDEVVSIMETVDCVVVMSGIDMVHVVLIWGEKGGAAGFVSCLFEMGCCCVCFMLFLFEYVMLLDKIGFI